MSGIANCISLSLAAVDDVRVRISPAISALFF